MKPQEIHDYKITWRLNDPLVAKLHMNFEQQGKDWCREYLKPQAWAFQKWITPEAHAFSFENEMSHNRFVQKFRKHIYE